jgi:apolipoprotein N-acyltransferase
MKGPLIVALGSLASGGLLTLSLPPADWGWVGWFCLVPLLLAVRGKGFLVGFIGGLMTLFSMAFVAEQGWFYEHKTFTGTAAWLNTGCGLFGFSVSLVAGAWADKGGSRRPIWWCAALAVVLEAALLIQLPAHLALTQYRNPSMMFIASVGGIWLVSYLTWLFNFSVAEAISKRNSKLSLLMVVLFAATVIGQSTWKLFPAPIARAVFGMIQTMESDSDSLARLHTAAAEKGASVVVWPEFSGIVMAPHGDPSELQALAKVSGAGIVTTYNDGHQPMPHNVATLIRGDKASEPYFKRKLFGGEKNMHTPGDRPVQAGKVALNTCFDTCFPHIIRESATLPGVEVVVLPTIDPESPHHFVAAMHAAFTPFRAAESGVPIVRADGMAHSMIVASNGQIHQELEPGESLAVSAISGKRDTIYRRLGDWILYMCAGLVLFGLLRYRAKPKG